MLAARVILLSSGKDSLQRLELPAHLHNVVLAEAARLVQEFYFVLN